MNDKKYVDLDDIRVPRDESGEIIAGEQETPIGLVRIRTMSYGDANKWQEMAGDIKNIPNKEIADLFKRKVVHPDLTELCEDNEKFDRDVMMREMKPRAIEILLKAIFAESKFPATAKVDQDGSAKIELEPGSKNPLKSKQR